MKARNGSGVFARGAARRNGGVCAYTPHSDEERGGTDDSPIRHYVHLLVLPRAAAVRLAAPKAPWAACSSSRSSRHRRTATASSSRTTGTTCRRATWPRRLQPHPNRLPLRSVAAAIDRAAIRFGAGDALRHAEPDASGSWGEPRTRAGSVPSAHDHRPPPTPLASRRSAR